MLLQSLPALLLAVGAASSLVSAQPMTMKRQSTSTISCQAKGDATWFYQGDAIYAGYGTLLGWKGPQLSFDGRSGDLTPFQVQSSICSSTALNLSTTNQPYGTPVPIKLYIADQPGKCLALASNTNANTLIVAADCSDDDTVDAQATQFWLRDYKYRTIKPYGSPSNGNWGVQIADNPEGWIFANPGTCFSGQTCQTDNQIGFRQG